jgi:hypothetical protein
MGAYAPATEKLYFEMLKTEQKFRTKISTLYSLFLHKSQKKNQFFMEWSYIIQDVREKLFIQKI